MARQVAAVEGGGEHAAVEVAGDRQADAVEQRRHHVHQLGVGEQGSRLHAGAVEQQHAVRRPLRAGSHLVEQEQPAQGPHPGGRRLGTVRRHHRQQLGRRHAVPQARQRQVELRVVGRQPARRLLVVGLLRALELHRRVAAQVLAGHRADAVEVEEQRLGLAILLQQQRGQRLARAVPRQRPRRVGRRRVAERGEQQRVELVRAQAEEARPRRHLLRPRRRRRRRVVEVAFAHREGRLRRDRRAGRPADDAAAHAEPRQDLPDRQHPAVAGVGAHGARAEGAPGAETEPRRHQVQIGAGGDPRHRQALLRHQAVLVRVLARRQGGPQRLAPVGDDRLEAAVGTAADHRRQERQAALAGQRQDGVQGRRFEAHHQQVRALQVGHRRRPRAGRRPRPERFAALHHDVDRHHRQQGDAEAAAAAVGAARQAVQQRRVEDDERRQAEQHRGLDQPPVDARRQEVGVVGSMPPVEQRRQRQRRGDAPGKPAPRPSRPPPQPGQGDEQRQRAEQGAVEQHAAQHRHRGEGQVRVEEEDQAGEVGAEEGAGEEAAHRHHQPAGKVQPRRCRRRRRPEGAGGLAARRAVVADRRRGGVRGSARGGALEGRSRDRGDGRTWGGRRTVRRTVR